jgi:hypothetical protein
LFSDEPFNVFTNSFAIFSEFFRGFFRSPKPVEEDEELDDESLEYPNATTTIKPAESIDMEGSGLDEIVAEGFLPAQMPEDESSLVGLPTETRRKPVPKKHFEYQVVEASGHPGD